MNGLILHAGAHAATIADLADVETPEPTETHVPIAHTFLVRLVADALTAHGLTIADEAYGLWGKRGERMFGVLTLRSTAHDSDFALTLGLRNAHDQRFAASGALGARVFVCDNLSFSGEVEFAGKHTARIVESLPGRVARAISLLIKQRGWQEQRFTAYKSAPLLRNADVHDLAVRLVDRGALPPSRVMDLVKEWRAPSHRAFTDRSVWSLFNCATEVLKGAPSLLVSRTMQLHSVCDEVVGLSRIATALDGDTN
jgi:hypothetical protein